MAITRKLRPIRPGSAPVRGQATSRIEGRRIRPEPRPITAATSFEVPDRVFRCTGLSSTARAVAVALCCLARKGEREVTANNEQIGAFADLGFRSVDVSLAELEHVGLVYRVSRASGTYEEDLAKLAALGYEFPARQRFPRRAIVLLWRLPAIGERAPVPAPAPAPSESRFALSSPDAGR